MGVHIDESGRDDHPLGVNDAGGLQIIDAAPEDGQRIALRANRAVVAGVPRSVDNHAVSYEQVEQVGRLQAVLRGDCSGFGGWGVREMR